MTIFEIPCFVQIEDKDKRKDVYNYLHEIGYKKSDRNCWELNKIIIARITHIQTSMGFMNRSFIDCGTNIPMFKALAALRDDSDYMQWFTDDYRLEWVRCNIDEPFECCIYPADVCDWHKATPAEIVEHFKDK